MPRLLIFGLGYTAARIAAAARNAGWAVTATRRHAADGALAFADDAAVRPAIAAATHILSSVPPDGEIDPVLVRYGDAIGHARLAYLSATGVYGDTGGAWVDESAATGGGRRRERVAADAGWLAAGARVFRLPGIYGPGRSPLDRLRAGIAHRVDVPGQVFSRVHVDDIAAGVMLGLDAPPGAYNLADDLPVSQNIVVEHAAALLGLPPPPFVPVESLSPMGRSFYAENRRIANGKAKRVLRWMPRYPDYRTGLRALVATAPSSQAE